MTYQYSEAEFLRIFTESKHTDAPQPLLAARFNRIFVPRRQMPILASGGRLSVADGVLMPKSDSRRRTARRRSNNRQQQTITPAWGSREEVPVLESPQFSLPSTPALSENTPIFGESNVGSGFLQNPAALSFPGVSEGPKPAPLFPLPPVPPLSAPSDQPLGLPLPFTGGLGPVGTLPDPMQAPPLLGAPGSLLPLAPASVPVTPPIVSPSLQVIPTKPVPEEPKKKPVPPPVKPTPAFTKPVKIAKPAPGESKPAVPATEAKPLEPTKKLTKAQRDRMRRKMRNALANQQSEADRSSMPTGAVSNAPGSSDGWMVSKGGAKQQRQSPKPTYLAAGERSTPTPSPQRKTFVTVPRGVIQGKLTDFGGPSPTKHFMRWALYELKKLRIATPSPTLVECLVAQQASDRYETIRVYAPGATSGQLAHFLAELQRRMNGGVKVEKHPVDAEFLG